MKRIKVVILSSVLALASFACSDDKKSPQQFPGFDTGNNANNTNNANNPTNNMVEDMDMPDAEVDMGNNNQMEDVGVDLNVMTPGFLHGIWTVNVLDGDTEIEGQFATFTFRHEEGETSATGIFKTQLGEGEMNTVEWSEDTLTASFNVRVNNISERFGITMGTADDQNTITGRYSWDKNGTFGDVELVRVEQ